MLDQVRVHAGSYENSILTGDMTHENLTVVRPGSPEFGATYLSYHRYRLKICVCSLVCIAAIVLVATSIVLQIANSSNIFPQSYELGEGDMRALSVSTMFCEGITLESDMNSRRLRVLSSLKLSARKQRTNVTTQMYIADNQYWYKAFYLLEGTSMLINAGSDSYFKLVILRGRQRLDEWIKTEERTRFAEEETKSAPDGVRSVHSTNFRTTQISYELYVQDTDNYYILFKHIAGLGTKSLALLDLSLSLNRVVYDVSPTLFTCEARPGQKCEARLLFGSEENVVIEVTSPDSLVYVNNVFTRWKCQTRIWFYIAIFGGCFFLTVIAGIIFYASCVSVTRRKLQAKMAEYEKRNPVNEMLIAPVTTVSRSASIRSHGSLRRYPSRTPSIRSQTSQMTNGSIIREVRPLLLSSVPMYNSIPPELEDDSEPESRHEERDDNGETEEHVNHQGYRPRNRTDSSGDNVSFHSFSSFDGRSRGTRFSTFRQRSHSEGSESHDEENPPRSSRASNINSANSSPKDSRANRSNSFSHYGSRRVGGTNDNCPRNPRALKRPFSFPTIIHAPPAPSTSGRRLQQTSRHGDSADAGNCPSENSHQSEQTSVPNPIVAHPVVEITNPEDNLDDVLELDQPEEIWVSTKPDLIGNSYNTLHSQEAEDTGKDKEYIYHTLPNGNVKKREKKRDYHGWKPRLSVVSESEV